MVPPPSSGDPEFPISVVVVNWNRLPLLQACFASLSLQSGVAFEVILVDNGSTDGSPDWAESSRADFPFPLSVIRNRENRGFCAANNQGIAAARGEFVALLNNDAEAEPRWLAELLRACSHGPRVGMAASKILVWENPRLLDKAGHLIWLDGQNRGRGSGEIDAGQYDSAPGSGTPWPDTLWPDGCACMYRKSMLLHIGGFDEDFFAYADDAELGLRARIAGWNCVYAPQSVVRHHRGSTLGVASFRRLKLIERNRVLLAAKLFPVSLLWRNPYYYAQRLLAGMRAAVHNRGELARLPSPAAKLIAALALVAGDLEALFLLPRILSKRRALRAIRQLSPREVEALIRANLISLRELSEQAIPPSGAVS